MRMKPWCSLKRGDIVSVYLDNLQNWIWPPSVYCSHKLPDSESAVSRTSRVRDSSLRRLGLWSLKSPQAASAVNCISGSMVACLRLPRSGERTEDISKVLAEYFLNKHSTLDEKKAPPLSNKVIRP